MQGRAECCKALYTGSIPVAASIDPMKVHDVIKLIEDDGWALVRRRGSRPLSANGYGAASKMR